MFIDLARVSVFPEQPPQNPLSPHPLYFGGEASLGGTLSFTGTGVTTFAFCGKKVACASTRVDDGGLDDDTALFDEFLYMRARVGIGDFCLLGGIKPDFALADTGDGCGEPLLSA
jgi:hypothetical protein